MLLRHTFCFAQLKIKEDTKYFDKESLSTTNYIAWRKLKFKDNPSLIPESTSCYKNHKDKCQFVAKIYLEFCDRQYAKNTGYKCYQEEDFNFDLCYKDYLEQVDLDKHWSLRQVIIEVDRFVQGPVGKLLHKHYVKDSLECFYPFLSKKIIFLPD